MFATLFLTTIIFFGFFFPIIFITLGKDKIFFLITNVSVSKGKSIVPFKRRTTKIGYLEIRERFNITTCKEFVEQCNDYNHKIKRIEEGHTNMDPT